LSAAESDWGVGDVACRLELEILSGTGSSRSTERAWPQGIALCPYRPPGALISEGGIKPIARCGLSIHQEGTLEGKD